MGSLFPRLTLLNHMLFLRKAILFLQNELTADLLKIVIIFSILKCGTLLWVGSGQPHLGKD